MKSGWIANCQRAVEAVYLMYRDSCATLTALDRVSLNNRWEAESSSFNMPSRSANITCLSSRTHVRSFVGSRGVDEQNAEELGLLLPCLQYGGRRHKSWLAPCMPNLGFVQVTPGALWRAQVHHR